MRKKVFCFLPLCLCAFFLLFFSCGKDKKILAEKKYNNGLSYLKMGILEQAEKELNEANKLSPNDAGILSALGQVYYSKKRFELAIPRFELAEKLNKTLQEPHFYLGNIYLELRRWDEAIKEFKDLIAMTTFSSVHIIYNALGIAYQEKGEYITAIKNLKEAVNFQSDFPLAYFNLGLVYLKMDNADQAIVEFNKAVSILPDYAEVYLQLGLIYVKKGDKKLAKDNFNKVMELAADSEMGRTAKSYLDLIHD